MWPQIAVIDLRWPFVRDNSVCCRRCIDVAKSCCYIWWRRCCKSCKQWYKQFCCQQKIKKRSWKDKGLLFDVFHSSCLNQASKNSHQKGKPWKWSFENDVYEDKQGMFHSILQSHWPTFGPIRVVELLLNLTETNLSLPKASHDVEFLKRSWYRYNQITLNRQCFVLLRSMLSSQKSRDEFKVSDWPWVIVNDTFTWVLIWFKCKQKNCARHQRCDFLKIETK